MFDIGFSELLVIALVGLIVLGPKRLPEVARTLGQWVAKARRFVADVKQDIDRELQQAELAELRNLKRELDETRQVVEHTSGDLIKQSNIAAPPEAAGVSPTLPSAAAAPGETATPAPDTPPAPKKPRTRRTKKKSTASRPANGRAR